MKDDAKSEFARWILDMAVYLSARLLRRAK